MTGSSSQVLRDGSKNRATAATSLNAHSSRSHALLSVKVTFAAARDGQPCTSTINLVDLAGSERVDKSEVRRLIWVGEICGSGWILAGGKERGAAIADSSGGRLGLTFPAGLLLMGRR